MFGHSAGRQSGQQNLPSLPNVKTTGRFLFLKVGSPFLLKNTDRHLIDRPLDGTNCQTEQFCIRSPADFAPARCRATPIPTPPLHSSMDKSFPRRTTRQAVSNPAAKPPQSDMDRGRNRWQWSPADAGVPPAGGQWMGVSLRQSRYWLKCYPAQGGTAHGNKGDRLPGAIGILQVAFQYDG